MTKTAPLHLFSRSDVEEYWRCPRASFYKRIFGGRGLDTPTSGMELVFGSAIHAAVHRILKGDEVSAVALAASELVEGEWRQVGVPKEAINSYEDPSIFFREQRWLTAAIVFGIDFYVLPILRSFGEIELVEKEVRVERDGSVLLTQPDMLIAPKDLDSFLYVEWKTVKKPGYQWFVHWTTAPQFMAAAKAVEETLHKPISLYQVVGIVKGEPYDGWHHSPFVYGWAKDNPYGEVEKLAFKFQDARTKGWYRAPAWKLADNPKQWIEMLPSEILELQFPMTSPMGIPVQQTEAFVRQAFLIEEKVREFKRLYAETGEITETGLDELFPQTFSQCDPSWGRSCWAHDLCWQPEVARDPLGSGKYVWRTSHHKAEREQIGIIYDEGEE